MVSLLGGRIKDREYAGGNVLLVRVALNSQLDFMAGQYVKLTLQTTSLSGAERSRFLSMASAPCDSRNIVFAFDISGSGFKKAILSSGIGMPVNVEGPRGKFVLRSRKSLPAVFISDRIGITPIRSIIEDATRRGLGHRICLFHHQSKEEENSMYSDILDFAKVNRKISAMWLGNVDRDGIIDCDETCGLLRNTLGKDFSRSAFYISGYPMNVVSIRSRLLDLDIPPERITMESFAGY